MKEKREVRAVRPDHHTTPASYADALKTPITITPQNPEPTATQPQSSNITELFKQLHDPECIEMFQMLKKFIAISKSGKSKSDRFTEIIPPTNIRNLIPDLQKIFRNRNNCLLLGDFNAKHNTWNNSLRSQNQAGREIHRFAHTYGLEIIAPSEPTRIPTRRNERPSTIDFCIAKGLTNTSVTVMEELSSDHHPLSFIIYPDNFSPPRNNVYKFTNWKKFQELLHHSIDGNPIICTPDDLDTATANFTETIQRTINQSSTCKFIPHAPLSLPQPIRTIIQTKNRLRKRWQDTRDPGIKKDLNKLQKTIHSILKNFKTANINEELKEASTHDCSLQRIMSLSTRSPIGHPRTNGKPPRCLLTYPLLKRGGSFDDLWPAIPEREHSSRNQTY
ncbi:putative RNA-directed DNA polymerase from transposon X-element [Nephila pilipes]|uniref:Putative RNA-directed DNA polymerase from transposon X-element n=1 Tax=Nephila pilipes TaxID=299642 RepID=A0A8X6PX32_NEPPI|nr:putative RNA-directed DNA polymerase from transposon X-element [Nephila pilipes]